MLTQGSAIQKTPIQEAIQEKEDLKDSIRHMNNIIKDRLLISKDSNYESLDTKKKSYSSFIQLFSSKTMI